MADPLWTTPESVDNQPRHPVDNSCSTEQSFPPHAPPFKDKDLSFLHQLVGSLVCENEVLTARIEAVEDTLNAVFGLLTAPLTQDERIERVRQIREGLYDTP